MVGCSSEQKSEEATDEKAATETTAEPVELQVLRRIRSPRRWKKFRLPTSRMATAMSRFADTQYKSSGELNEMLGAGSMPTC